MLQEYFIAKASRRGRREGDSSQEDVKITVNKKVFSKLKSHISAAPLPYRMMGESQGSPTALPVLDSTSRPGQARRRRRTTTHNTSSIVGAFYKTKKRKERAIQIQTRRRKGSRSKQLLVQYLPSKIQHLADSGSHSHGRGRWSCTRAE